MRKKNIQLENIDLVLKIAWKYKKVSKESIDDLFQEGYLSLIKAKETYDPHKGKFSTHAWHCVSSDIKDYLKLVENQKKRYNLVEDFSAMQIEEPQSDFFERLPEEAMEIAKLVLNAPKSFVVRTQMEAKERVQNILSEQGWPMEKIFFGLQQLNKACAL